MLAAGCERWRQIAANQKYQLVLTCSLEFAEFAAFPVKVCPWQFIEC